MTNFDSFTKPIVHFGNAHEPRPVPPATIEPETKPEAE